MVSLFKSWLLTHVLHTFCTTRPKRKLGKQLFKKLHHLLVIIRLLLCGEKHHNFKDQVCFLVWNSVNFSISKYPFCKSEQNITPSKCLSLFCISVISVQ